MSKTSAITEKQIRARASESSFSRGRQYHKEDAISNTIKRGDEIEGQCQGSMPYPYHIQVAFDKQDIVHTSCTCEYDYGGDCKHIVALLLTYLDNPELFEERPSIQDTLNERSKEELIALIHKMIEHYPDLQSLVDRPTPGKQTVVNVDSLRREMRQAFQPRYDYYGEYETHGGVHSVYSMTDTAAEFAAQGDWKNASAIYRAIVEESLSLDEMMLDDEGEFVEGLNNTLEKLAACLEAPELADNIQERQAVFDALLQAYIWDVNFGGIGLGDDVPDLVLRYARVEDLPHIRQQIDSAKKQQRTRSYSGWGIEAYEGFLVSLDVLDNIDPETTLARLREEEMYDLLVRKLLEMGRRDEAVREIEAHLISPYERLRILPTLVNAGQEDTAIRLANQTLIKQYDDNLMHWLLEMHQRRGDKEAYFRAQLQRMENQPHINHYAQLQEASKAVGTWDNVRVSMLKRLEKQQRYDVLTQVYLNDEEWDLAWDTLAKLENAPSQFSWGASHLELQVAQQSAMARPDKALPIFLKQVRQEIGNRDRKSYASAAELLTVVRDIYRRTSKDTEWQTYITALRAEFSRLPALQDELRKAKL